MKNYLTGFMRRAALKTVTARRFLFVVFIFAPGLLASATASAGQVRRPGPVPLGRPTACCSITAINTSTGVVSAKENATGRIFQFKVNDAAMLNSLKAGQGVYANFTTNQVSLDGNTNCCAIITTAAQPPPPAPTAPPPVVNKPVANPAPAQGPPVSATPPPPAANKPATSPAPATGAAAPAVNRPATGPAAAPATGVAPGAVGPVQNRPTPAGPNGSITAIDASTGVVTAKDNTTGNIFQFNLNDATQLNSLQIGQGVYANFAAKMVSLNGSAPAGSIIAIQPATSLQPAAAAQAPAANRPGIGPAAAPVSGVGPAAVGQVQNKPTPVGPCCGITAIDANSGVVAAKDNITGIVFQFHLNDATQVNSLQIGQGVYANFAAKMVSLNGNTPAGTIIATQPAMATSLATAPGAAPAAVGQLNSPTPGEPCCNITTTNTRTGVVTATEIATGRSITFQIAHFQPVDGVKLSQTFPVGGKVDFQPVDGIALRSGSNVRLTVLGFQPVDGIVASIGTAATSGGAAAKGVARENMQPPRTTPSSPSTGLAHTVQNSALIPLGLPSVAAGTPQRLQGGLQQVPTGVRYGSSGSRVNQDVVHLRGTAGIQQASGLPEGAKNLLLLHVNTLAPGEVDHYIVNKKLAADWIAAHPALANVKPPASHDSGAGCSVTITNPCLGADVQHITDQTSQQINNLLDAGRKEWQDVTHQLSHDLQMVETCFADQTLHLNDVPVDISPSDVPDLTFRFDKGGKPNSAVKANNQFGAITGSAEVTGKLTFGLPMDAHFKAGVDMFWIECLPFFIRPKNIHADGTFALGTKIGAELTAAGQFTQEFNIAAGRIPIAIIPIVIAGIPIAEMDVSAYMEGKVLVDGNGRLDAQFSLETQRQTNDFDFVCSGHGCDGLNPHGGATKPETTAESVKLDGRIHIKPEIYTALQLDFDNDALSARAGPEFYLLGEVYACGAASGTQTAGAPSTSQDSYALTADLDWGIDLRAEALVGGALVGKPNISKLLKPRHLAFWDLAHSTALLPRAEGLTQAAMGTPAVYKIKMPTCYPYPDKVKYQVSWTGGATASNGASGTTVASGGSGGTAASRSLAQKGAGLKAGGNGGPSTSSSACNLQSGQGSCEFDPVKDFSLDLAWPTAGNYNLTVTAVGDTPHGREYKSAQATTLNVTVESTASGSTPSSGSGSTTSAATGGTPPAPPSTSGTTTSASNGGTPSASPATCCGITAVDQSSGVVTANVRSTGEVFQFKVPDSATRNPVQVGQGIYANFAAKRVSLNGTDACCDIIGTSPTQASGVAAGAGLNKPVTGNLQRFTPPPPDPNPNHLPDLVPDAGSGFGECSIPAGSSCQAACGSKKVPTNFGVHNLTQFPATGPIHIVLKKIGSSAPDQTWTVNGLDGNQWAYPGGFYTMWKCPTSQGTSNPADNYTLEVQGPPQLTTNNKTMQLYIPPDAVRCAGGVDWSGCQK